MVCQLLFVLTAIIIGARLGGIGLGVMGGVGLGILTFVFGLQTHCTTDRRNADDSCRYFRSFRMQAVGGLDYMVKLAENCCARTRLRLLSSAPSSPICLLS